METHPTQIDELVTLICLLSWPTHTSEAQPWCKSRGMLKECKRVFKVPCGVRHAVIYLSQCTQVVHIWSLQKFFCGSSPGPESMKRWVLQVHGSQCLIKIKANPKPASRVVHPRAKWFVSAVKGRRFYGDVDHPGNTAWKLVSARLPVCSSCSRPCKLCTSGPGI